MKVFTQSLRNQYVIYLDHLAERKLKAKASSTQLMREGLNTHMISDIGSQEMPTCLRSQILMRRYGVMSARE
jgi:hypothetical protein